MKGGVEMLGLRRKVVFLMIFVLIISALIVVPSLQAGKCSDEFAECINNVSTSWWKGPLDFLECEVEFLACLAHKF